jgi:hypothetical protein
MQDIPHMPIIFNQKPEISSYNFSNKSLIFTDRIHTPSEGIDLSKRQLLVGKSVYKRNRGSY